MFLHLSVLRRAPSNQKSWKNFYGSLEWQHDEFSGKSLSEPAKHYTDATRQGQILLSDVLADTDGNIDPGRGHAIP